MIFFRKRHKPASPTAPAPKPLNPDFNFWENRSENAPKSPVETSQPAQRESRAAAQVVIASENTGADHLPPDKSHTLLVKGKWVRPWGLRNFAYSFVALIGLQVILSLVIFGLASAKISALVASGEIDTAEITKQVTAVAMIPWVLALSQFSMYGLWLGYMWWASRYRGARSWAKDFALRIKWWDVLIGLGSAGALLGLETLVTGWIQALAPDQDYSGMDNGAIFSNQSGAWFFIVGIGIAGIVGPICEELYFRGFFLTGIQRWFARYVPRLGRGWVSTIAIILTSILFGLVHFQGIDTFGQILVIFFTGTIGVLLAVYRVAFKRLGPGIFTHISFNTIGLLLTYFATMGS